MEEIAFSRILSGEKTFSIILLNQPICNGKLFEKLWQKADLRICADGGFIQLVEFRDIDKEPKAIKMPDAVVGDMDSLSKHWIIDLRTKGVEIVKDVDDSINDFEKALNYLHSRSYSSDIVLYGALGGRFDHTIANIGMTCRWNRNRLWIVDKDNIITRLFSGTTQISINPLYEGPHCGFFSLGSEKPIVTTEGFVWNIKETALSFPEFFSSSNLIANHDRGETTIAISTTAPIIWTIEFQAGKVL